MIDPSTRLIAQIKLHELRRQRDRLMEHYTALEQATAGKGPVEQLRILYQGLQEARFAQKPLHPDVANLEALLYEADLGTASPEMIEQWVRRLRREVDQGRLRAEFAFGFGRLLDEWMAAADAAPTREPPGPHPLEEKLRLLFEPENGPLDLEMLRGMFQRHQAVFQTVRDEVRAFADKEAGVAATTDNVRALLKALSNDVTRKPELRRQAMTLSGDDMQMNEYAGALTILLDNLAAWDWPAEGFDLRALWTRTKWRPYLDEDLLTLLFHQLIGFRWGIKLKTIFRTRLNLADPQGLFLAAGSGPTAAPRPAGVATPPGAVGLLGVNSVASLRKVEHDKLFLPMVPNSMRDLSDRGGYTGGHDAAGLTPESLDTFQQLLLFLNAEIQLAAAAFPDRPLYVVQTDLRDYYLRVPHAVVACLLENLGFPEPWLGFFRKTLAVPVRRDGRTRVVRRGLMLDHLFSDVIAEYLLLFLDVFVHQEAGVRLFRVVDDVFFLADSEAQARSGWQAIQTFCRACGLEVNEEKSGALKLGGGSVSGLPAAAPRWGFLQLRPDGAWGLDEAAWERFRELVRGHLDRPLPVLTLISLYNAYLKYILKFLGLAAPLGQDHRGQIGRALAGLHNGLFGPGRGIAEEVRRRLGETPGGAADRRLPEALFYWPLTAGGLGLFHPVSALAAYHGPALARTPPPVPATREADWLRRAAGPWGKFFRACLQPLTPNAPAATPGLKGLLDDFLTRGSEMAGKPAGRTVVRRKPAALSLYWQWVVYTYGPQLIDSLGTFRFLIEQLVPLQLIIQNRIDASSLTGTGDSGSPVDAPAATGDAEDVPF